jgi:hypothetical protein
VPRLRRVIVKEKKQFDNNKSAIITKKEVVSINQLNYKAREKSLATEELVGYNTQCYLEFYVFRFLVIVAPLMQRN